jgi:hypothetical protein
VPELALQLGENIGLNILRPEIACGNAENITDVGTMS